MLPTIVPKLIFSIFPWSFSSVNQHLHHYHITAIRRTHTHRLDQIKISQANQICVCTRMHACRREKEKERKREREEKDPIPGSDMTIKQMYCIQTECHYSFTMNSDQAVLGAVCASQNKVSSLGSQQQEPISCFYSVMYKQPLDRILVYHRALPPIYLLNAECQAETHRVP
jgi:hypothetical protein